MAQIFLGKNSSSLAVELMAKYSRAVDSDLVKLVQTTPDEAKVLGISSLPTLVATEGDKTFKCASPYAIFRHLAEATRFEKIFLGRDDAQNNQILSYFELVNQLEASDIAELINNDLTLRMFLVGYNITAADIFTYAHVVEHVQGLKDFEKVQQNNLFRWVDHIQSLPGISKFAEQTHMIVSFPDENAKGPSKRELKKLAKKQAQTDGKANKGGDKPKGGENPKAEKAQNKDNPNAEKAQNKGNPEEEKKADLGASTTTASTDAPKKVKKPKVQNPPKNKGKKEPEIECENIAKLDIRVGKITKVWKHPDSDKLYCEEIDIGEETPRQIASGLQAFVPIEKMQDAMVVVLTNLKARKLAGFASQGMVLCAETIDKSAVELLVAPEGSQIGDKVSIKGFEMHPLEVMNPKKKIFESVVDDLVIDANGVAKYKNAEFITDKGMIVSEGIKNGIIR
jgi:aminoacyl tRNA synthase complex-interacting multifunctional protein 1